VLEVTVISKVDARVQDGVALDEIELYGELMIAASQSQRPLTREEIDAILGVGPAAR
jgi:hypothetical protein